MPPWRDCDRLDLTQAELVSLLVSLESLPRPIDETAAFLIPFQQQGISFELRWGTLLSPLINRSALRMNGPIVEVHARFRPGEERLTCGNQNGGLFARQENGQALICCMGDFKHQIWFAISVEIPAKEPGRRFACQRIPRLELGQSHGDILRLACTDMKPLETGHQKHLECLYAHDAPWKNETKPSVGSPRWPG